MAATVNFLRHFSKAKNLTSIARRDFTVGRIYFNRPQGAQPTPKSNPAATGNVPGLSQNVVKVSSEPVGPGAAKTSQYKNPEYFCYNQMSYFEAEIEMSKYRLPQPSNKK